ncbi:hypothetical protein GWI33_019790 [Rhynchophorus ferrugineus]|uniref:Reverse transcriptase n=1 Tax=Rhynchophorus ferrugineus TaxID=354439 RepID=A0A834M123_RHYFE|nr:hypothetical protein GWI33_019790 [Rhynchophorus ferrugineus]
MQSSGYNDGADRISKLKRSLYGLRQALRCWNKRVNKYFEKPTSEDIVRLKRVFRYVAGTPNYGIIYRSNPESDILECCNDTDLEVV